MISTRNVSRSVVALATVLASLDAAAAVEAISKASPPSETVEVFRGVGGWGPNYVLPPSYVDVSSNGRYVLYRSAATNVLAGVVENVAGDDLFLLDRVSRQTTLVTHRPGSSEPFNQPVAGRLSEDGSTVIFSLGPDDESGFHNVGPQYIFDRSSGTTRLVAEGPAPIGRMISSDGSWSVLITWLSGESRRLALYEKTLAALHEIALPAGCSVSNAYPEISADGGTVLFQMLCASGYAVALYDRVSQNLSIVKEQAEQGTLSRDGRFALFSARGPNVIPGLVVTNGNGPNLFRHDRVTQETILVTRGATPLTTWSGPGIEVHSARISDDGNVVAFTGREGFPDEPFVFFASTGTLRKAQTQSPDRIAMLGLALSGDGRTLVYTTYAQVVAVDTPTMTSRNLTTTSFPGVLPNARPFEPVISRDGSLVVFASAASNLGSGIRDFDTTSRDGASLFGAELPSDRVVPLSLAGSPSQVQLVWNGRWGWGGHAEFLSGDGRRVAFGALSNASEAPDASLREPAPILRDRSTGSAKRLGELGTVLALSEDGSTTIVPRVMGYSAYRGDLVQNLEIARPAYGRPEATVSGDGSRVAYLGGDESTDDATINIWDVSTGRTTMLHRSASWVYAPDNSPRPVISTNGAVVAFQASVGGLQVFIHDLAEGSTRLVSRTVPGVLASGASRLAKGRVLSADGRYLVLTTEALSMGGLTLPAGGSSVVLYDRVLDAHTLVSGPLDDLPYADLATLDAEGRFIVFRRSRCQCFLEQSRSVFLFDRLTGLYRRVTPAVPGGQQDDLDVLISADGSTLAFSHSDVPQAWPYTNPAQVYVVDRRTGRTSLASHGATSDTPGSGMSLLSAIDSRGDLVVFTSNSNNLGNDLGFTAGGLGGFSYAAFAFTVPPIVYSVSPPCASTTGGRAVTIDGAHFKPGSTVTLDGIPATVTSVTSTAITAIAGARAPAAARTGHVEVRSPDGEYYALGNAFTYAVRGDANNSGALTAADGFYLKMALFLGGPQPATLCNGDANGSGATTSADAFFLNLYLFLGGAPPPP